MIDQMGYAAGMEIGENWDDHGLIGVDGQEGYRPARHILRAEGDLVALPDSEGGE